MNPLERLRYIARIEGEDPVDLALEVTYIIAELASDRALLVSALRRLLDRHPGYGILWMVAARVAGSVFPEDEAWSLVGELSMPRSEPRGLALTGLHVSRNGNMSIVDERNCRVNIGASTERAVDFIKSHSESSLVIDSDLVSSQFALLPVVGVRLIDGYSAHMTSVHLTIRASDFSLVSPTIKGSLESRIAAAGQSSAAGLVDLKGIHQLVYQGSSLSPKVLDRMVSWKVPQEVLHSAGPMLG